MELYQYKLYNGKLEVNYLDVRETAKMYYRVDGKDFGYNYYKGMPKNKINEILVHWGKTFYYYSTDKNKEKFLIQEVLKEERRKLERIKKSVSDQEQNCKKLEELLNELKKMED